MDDRKLTAIPIRFTAIEAAMVRQAARDERRPISQFVRVKTIEALEAAGYLPIASGAGLNRADDGSQVVTTA